MIKLFGTDVSTQSTQTITALNSHVLSQDVHKWTELQTLDLDNASHIEFIQSLLQKDISDAPATLSLLFRTLYNSQPQTENQQAMWGFITRVFFFQLDESDAINKFCTLASVYKHNSVAQRTESILCQTIIDRFCKTEDVRTFDLYTKNYVLLPFQNNINRYFSSDKWNNPVTRVVILYSILGVLRFEECNNFRLEKYSFLREQICQPFFVPTLRLLRRYIDTEIPANSPLKESMTDSLERLLNP